MKCLFFLVCVSFLTSIDAYAANLPKATLQTVVRLIQDGKYADLVSRYFQDEKKVRFAPHANLRPSDRQMSKTEILDALKKDVILRWGYFEGSGLPIDLSVKDYFENFVTLDPNKQYKTTINRRILETDGAESVYKEYGKDVVVDIMSNWDSPNQWEGIKIVLRYSEGSWWIVCLVFNRYEI